VNHAGLHRLEPGAESVDRQGLVIPLLIDLPPADLKGPLMAFQWRLFNDKDVRLLVHDVNNAAEQQVAEKNSTDSSI
jgi:hypothetical protein